METRSLGAAGMLHDVRCDRTPHEAVCDCTAVGHKTCWDKYSFDYQEWSAKEERYLRRYCRPASFAVPRNDRSHFFVFFSTTMMMMRSLLLSLLVNAAVAISSAPLGKINMQMRSSQTTIPSKFIVEILEITVPFLDGVLENAYRKENKYIYEQVRLSVQNYDIVADNGGFVATVELRGTAFFKDDAPADMSPLIVDAFSDYNEVYLESLTSSKDNFLQGLSYAVVTVDGNVAMEDRNKKGGIGGDSLDTWMIALIAGGIAFVAVMSVCVILFCCCVGGGSTTASSMTDIPKSRTAESRDTRSTEDYATTRRSRSPSPVRSITSQDSSKFTYNPKSSCRSKGSFDFNGSALEMDVEAWQKGSTINGNHTLPFGHDISAIETKKDLSLIQEENSDSTPDSLLSERKLRALEMGTSRPMLDLNAPARDVLDELNDLSFQISSLRKGRS